MFERKKLNVNLQRRAQAAKQSNRYRKIVPSVVGVLAAFMLIVYVASLLFSQYGSFTIHIKEYGDRAYALTLAENDVFAQASSKLTAKELKNVNNITYTNLPNNLNDIDGSHNGENYLAYTFYLKNAGEKECSYTYSLLISQATVGIDAAVRVRIYFNPDYYKSATGKRVHSGAYTDYAKPKTGGNGLPEVDPGNRVMTNFVNNDVAVFARVDGFQPGDIAKFTVVIWLEGEDPDCTDDVLGGQLKTDMDIAIVGAGESD